MCYTTSIAYVLMFLGSHTRAQASNNITHEERKAQPRYVNMYMYVVCTDGLYALAHIYTHIYTHIP